MLYFLKMMRERSFELCIKLAKFGSKNSNGSNKRDKIERMAVKNADSTVPQKWRERTITVKNLKIEKKCYSLSFYKMASSLLASELMFTKFIFLNSAIGKGRERWCIR